MKIGILGAPGSGKSEFAKALADELSWDWKGCVIDGYVDELRDSTGLEYGGFGEFIDDMQIVFKRREWELTLKDSNTITVGTVLDSTIQNFIRTEETAHTRDEIAYTTQRLQAIASTFGLVYTDSWDYDYAFVLYSDDKIGRALMDLLVMYRAPVMSFQPEVPDDEKARTAAQAIRTLEEEDSIASSQERGVRPGGEASETGGGSLEPVPDVPEQRGAPDDA